jgi:hypothetical protein
VVEKRKGPAREATHKVGESTSESAAHYFADILDLRDHLERDELHKFGLRFFWPADGNHDIRRRCEFGPLEDLLVTSYQLDRGRFENHLAATNDALGIGRWDGARVVDVELGTDLHAVTIERNAERVVVQARWLIDAGGRAALLKREKGLERDFEHTINSAWWRLDGGLDVEDFSDDPAWRNLDLGGGVKMTPHARWRSTTHLLGVGYWVWIIPLASGPVSIGIVADPRYHPLEEYDTFEKARAWLAKHEPQLADAMRGREGQVLDFLKVGDFAHSCERLFSTDRWLLTGDAGLFLDPFYSPGSDCITYVNTLITDLVTRDLEGEEVRERLEAHNDYMLRVFESLHELYNDQYAFFGNPAVMFPKIIWDATYNWGGNGVLLFQKRLTDLAFRTRVVDAMGSVWALNAIVQRMLREWHALEHRRYEGLYFLPPPFFVELNEQLVEKLDDDAMEARIRHNVKRLEAIAVGLFFKAADLLPAPPDPNVAVNPYALSLDPARWEADGLFAARGLTRAQAMEVAEGLEAVFVDQY